jgi:hypothetical protein
MPALPDTGSDGAGTAEGVAARGVADGAEGRRPLSALATDFARFADTECGAEPLYAAICRTVAREPAWLQWLWQAPRSQQRPTLWLAALHERLLAADDDARATPDAASPGASPPHAHWPAIRTDRAANRRALQAYWPSLGGQQAPDASLPAALAAFLADEAPALQAHLRARTTQTNEIGRCAVLWPALQAIAQRTGRARLALLDIGCSAGLNLAVDRYCCDYGGFTLGAAAGPGVPLLNCRLVGPCLPPGAPDAQAAPAASARGASSLPPWTLEHRLGLDIAPIDLADAAARRWLRACLWPHDAARARRFAQAAALALAMPSPLAVRQCDDCAAAVAPWLDSLPSDVQPVIFNSWVLTYFDAPLRRRHTEQMLALVRQRDAVWLSAEEPGVTPNAPLPPPHPDQPAGSHTVWTLCRRVAGNVQFENLARSHGHGHWMEWLATPPA